MAVEVIDASALGAVLFVEPDAARVASRIDAGSLVAPALLDVELASTCLKKLRHHPELRQLLLSGLSARARFANRLVEVDPIDVVALAEESGLSAHDASYLWVARRLGAGLITLDRELAAAAGH
jgi:predicted nucleic acid-binding protein